MNDIILRPPTKKELKYLKDKNISFTFTDFAKATSKYDDTVYEGYMLIKGPFPQGISLLDYWHNVKRIEYIPYRDIFYYPVIDATKKLLESKSKHYKLNIGRFPTKKVSEELEDELNSHFNNGDLEVTEYFYGRCPEFRYKGNYYVIGYNWGSFDSEGRSRETLASNSIEKVAQYIKNIHDTEISHNWFKVEDIYFRYIEDLNILVPDNVLLSMIANMLEDKKDQLYFYNLFNRKNIISRRKLGTVNDYINLSRVSVGNIVSDKNTLSPITPFAKFWQGGEKYPMYKVRMEFDKETIDNCVKWIDPVTLVSRIQYGEFPQGEVNVRGLNGFTTGNEYNILCSNEWVDNLEEYYDKEKNIKYVWICDEYYSGYFSILPLEWEYVMPGSHSNTDVYETVIGIMSSTENNDNALRRYLITYFMHDIAQNDNRIKIIREIDSNLGYQLLMNRAGIKESDLELNKDNKLVLKPKQ